MPELPEVQTVVRAGRTPAGAANRGRSVAPSGYRTPRRCNLRRALVGRTITRIPRAVNASFSRWMTAIGSISSGDDRKLTLEAPESAIPTTYALEC